ncbi:MAG: YfiR family protein [Marinilabiliaceae bacterium]|nr:YfiR family protein [Marinilabiliaceae bacterium]
MLKRKIIVLGIVLLTFVSVFESKAQLQKVQASFIVNFFRYIQWPELNSNDFVVGVYGTNPAIIKELNSMAAGQKYRNTSIKVIEVVSVEEAAKCQILFLSAGNSNLPKRMKEVLNNASTLIITEEQNYMPSHSVINFKVVDQKLIFSVNQKNAELRNLAINSRLLALAK